MRACELMAPPTVNTHTRTSSRPVVREYHESDEACFVAAARSGHLRFDIPLLADHFLRQYGGASPPRLTEEAMEALQRYRWPGNVRELRNVIERAVLLANGGVINASDLPLQAHGPATSGGNGNGGPSVSLAELERRHIESVLSQTNWHQGKAATLLGISSKTLYRKIREYGFKRPGES